MSKGNIYSLNNDAFMNFINSDISLGSFELEQHNLDIDVDETRFDNN